MSEGNRFLSNVTQTLRTCFATQSSGTQVCVLNTDIRGIWRTPRKWESRRPSLPTLLWASCTWRPTCHTRSPSGMGVHSSWVTSTPLEVYWLWVSSCVFLHLRKNDKGWWKSDALTSRFQVFFVMFFGTYALGQASPNLQMFATARGAAYKVYSIIDQVGMIIFIRYRYILNNQR